MSPDICGYRYKARANTGLYAFTLSHAPTWPREAAGAVPFARVIVSGKQSQGRMS
jgi:hypothetical protein